MPVWWGLALSLNNFSTCVMKQPNQPTALAYLVHRLGIKSFVDPTPAMCLGTADVTLLKMVSAYSNFVNMGVHIEPIFVTRIEDRHGNILATFAPQSYDAISQQSAFDMLGMLQNVVNKGTAGRLRWSYQFVGELGGKTGTTDNNSDAWFIGIAPKIVVGTWVGGEDRSIHLSSAGEGSVVALPTFGLFMQKVYADPAIGVSEKDVFVKPAGVERFDCESSGGEIESETVNRLSIDDDEFFQ